MKILNLLTILDKKHPLYVFFYLKLQNLEIVGLFYPTGTMSRKHTFEKRQCDRCRHRSVVNNTPPPSHSFPVPIPAPHRTHHPSANCPGPMISGLLDHVTSSANGCGAPGPWRNRFRSVPRSPLAQCRPAPNNSNQAVEKNSVYMTTLHVLSLLPLRHI